MFAQKQHTNSQKDISKNSLDIFYTIIRKLFGPIVRLIWIRQVEGIENIPKQGPIIIAFNHSSYFDFISFIAVSPRNIHYLAAEKFFESPFWRSIMAITGQIHVDRKSKDKRNVMNAVLNHLQNGMALGIFPEGTRSPDGQMLPAFRGVAMYAVRANIPVIPIGIVGAYEVLSRFNKFPRFGKKIRIKIGKPISFEKYTKTKLNKKDYDILTKGIMNKIADLCGSVYPYHKDTLNSRRQKKHPVVFDIDDTLIKDQSQKIFIKFLREKKYITKKLYYKILIWFFLYKIGFVKDPKKIMVSVYKILLKGKNVSEVDVLIEDCFNKKILPVFSNKIVKILHDHKKHGRHIILISNAVEPIVRRIAEHLNVHDYIATKLEIVNNVYTGKILGTIIYGPTRAFAVRNFIAKNNLAYKKIWVYTDHISDVALLRIARHGTVVNPGKKLRKIAKKEGWAIMKC